MNLGLLYLLLLKATVTSFSGMGSLPQIRQDFVATHRVLSDDQLSQAVLVGRATPGPMGAYVVAVGFMTAGVPGAVIGWLAMITPAVAAIPLLVVVRRWLHVMRVRAVVDAVVIGGAALLLPAAYGLARDGIVQLLRIAGVVP